MSLDRLLHTYPSLANSKGVNALIAAMPFVRLKAQLEEQNLPFPKAYASVQGKLSQLQSDSVTEQVYKIKEGKTMKTVSLAAYRSSLQDTLERFQEEAFFKRRLAADIDLAFVIIQNNREVIASHKGMDDDWVKETLRELRSKNRKLQHELSLVLQLIASQVSQVL